VTDVLAAETTPAGKPSLFGAAELLAAVAGARRVLDVGCGSGRLTVALALAGAEVTGFDTSSERLDQARRRAVEAGVGLSVVDADLNGPLPFADRSFDAVASRLSLMVARDPVATLRELRRVLEPGGRLVTAIWAALEENPWFAASREAVGAVLGPSKASFAGSFGRLGDLDEAAAVHRAAGLREVDAVHLCERVTASGAAEHWERLARENGHYGRIDADLTDAERTAIVDEVELRLARYRAGDHLSVPRALVLVTARG
jgi:SAM-dependent methyltransferase